MINKDHVLMLKYTWGKYMGLRYQYVKINVSSFILFYSAIHIQEFKQRGIQSGLRLLKIPFLYIPKY